MVARDADWLAEVARKRGFCGPEISESDIQEILARVTYLSILTQKSSTAPFSVQ